MGNQATIRVGREVLYKDGSTLRPAKITAIGASGLVDLTVFTNANADGVTRVQGVDPRPTAGLVFPTGPGTGSSNV
jgi:hypothetical protein